MKEVKNFFQNLDPKKVAQKDDMKTNLLKKNADPFCEIRMWRHQWFNSFLQNFPPNWNKRTSYQHIKKSKLSKENYRPISIHPNVSKIYKRCLYDQIASYFEHIFSRYEYGFRKGYSAQHCLLATVEEWEKVVDEKGVFGALLTDLSKVFDCIPHDLIIAKLEANGFHKDALKLIHDYLSKRKQMFEVNDAYSLWKDIFYGVPQDFILSTLLFNIHLFDLFYFLKDLDMT